ncbi:sugar-binding transcriptional regulator [Paracoccus seriniphilus]|uniref:DNA-binding transcriptional regulator LsrR, DeoR family n=1 Tax=Paracoccus seriniphilus TaxID=184748 RepID=A0A239Q209_9RHOB|nr:sugar-binding transcriptional regulator [Paracoccus seriniphilus]WCR16203.1 sugar-binding transcriptional regulator [Paracoccus seriniphilus]SNT76525.1 DNA-binding transcriptional regulator LsrR, DeoR family [Paracoccus seriniphilus]
MARRGTSDPEKDLSIRAAWLHYAGGLTQAAVAKRLGVPSVKAHRLIARAVADGAVKVSIDGEIVACAKLEAELCDRYGLDYCEVAPDLGEEGLPLRALGLAGAAFLRRQIERGEHKVIGVGHGRTLAAAVQQMPRLDARGIRFVSLLGGFSRNYAANPHDVMHSLAEKTGAVAHVLPVPFFANSESDRAILLAQPGVGEIFDLSNGATLKFAGMGPADSTAQLVASGMIEPDEIAEINAAGGVGEILGNFFDAEGRVLETGLSSRTLSVDLDGPAASRIIAIAGGREKIAAIRAVLRSGRLSGLITDEASARAILEVAA